MNGMDLELFFLTLMEEKGVENEAMLVDFYDWVEDILNYAIEEYKADAEWEEDEEDD